MIINYRSNSVVLFLLSNSTLFSSLLGHNTKALIAGQRPEMASPIVFRNFRCLTFHSPSLVFVITVGKFLHCVWRPKTGSYCHDLPDESATKRASLICKLQSYAH